MKRFLSFLLSCALASAATVTVCDSGCTDVTANLQNVINARACGDHVQLKAQATAYPPFYLPGGTALQCGANPIYIENFAMSSLPPTGTLITPAYAPLLPNIQATASAIHALYTHNGGADCGGGSNHCPANGWVIQGLQFTQTTDRGQNPCYIMLGYFDSTCTSDTSNIIVLADMPTNITFQHNFVQPSPYNVTRRCLNVDVYLGTIQDNWIDCISPTLQDGSTGDSQVLAGGPVGTSSSHFIVKNNVLIGGTETISWGVYPALVKTPVYTSNAAFGWMDQTTTGAQYVDVIGNHIQHDPYALTATWAANTWYRIGQAIVSSTGAGPVFIAVTTGKSAGSEPNWAGTAVNNNLTDGTITWRHVDNVWGATDAVTGLLCGYSVKNHWESKSLLFGRVLNNFLDRLWSQCAAFGNQGRSLVPEVQTSSNGGGAASNIQDVVLANNLGTNLSGAFGTLFSLSFDDANRFPRFFGTAVEPYTINAGNQTLNISIDGAAPTTITLTTGTRTAKQIADEINALALTNISAAAYYMAGNNTSSCTTSSTVCQILFQRSGTPNTTIPLFTSDSTPNPWNASGTPISIGPATGTTATTVLGLPANGTNVVSCTNPQSLVWYGCGQGASVSLTNNIFQMRHDGAYQPYASYIGLINSGVDGFTLDHNLFTDPSGWYGSIPYLMTTPAANGGDGIAHLGHKNMLLQNNLFQDTTHYVGTSDGSNHIDWSGINYGCQTATLNSALTTGGDQAAECDSAHLKGGFTRNLAYGINFTNATCTVAGTTCNTNPADNDLGFGAQPNDNPNADQFSSLVFRQASPSNTAQPDYTLVYNPSSPQKYVSNANCPGTPASGCYLANDNRPLGPDMTQMNFVRLAGGAPVVSDRAAIFTINTTPALQGTHGQLIVATDPFCFNPVADMDPTMFTNPGWTGNDAFPINGATHQVIVGLNSPLSASTTYYYCLEYQGYGLTGSFTTSATMSGTVSVGFSFDPPANLVGGAGTSELVLMYGTSYSRATDTISGGGTTTAVACTLGGGVCTATPAVVTKGVPLLTRYALRNSGHTIVKLSPVLAVFP